MKRSAKYVELSERTKKSHVQSKEKKKIVDQLVGFAQSAYTTVTSVFKRLSFVGEEEGVSELKENRGTDDCQIKRLGVYSTDDDVGASRHTHAQSEIRPSANKVVDRIDLTVCSSPEYDVQKDRGILCSSLVGNSYPSHQTDGDKTVWRRPRPSNLRSTRQFHPYRFRAAEDNPVRLDEKEKYLQQLSERYGQYMQGRRQTLTARNLERTQDNMVYGKLFESFSNGLGGLLRKDNIVCREKKKIPRLFRGTGQNSKQECSITSVATSKPQTKSVEERVSDVKSVLSFRSVKKPVVSSQLVDVDVFSSDGKQHQHRPSQRTTRMPKDLPETSTPKSPLHSSDIIYVGTRDRGSPHESHRMVLKRHEPVEVFDSPETKQTEPAMQKPMVLSPPRRDYKTSQYDKEWLHRIKLEHSEGNRRLNQEIAATAKLQDECRHHDEEIDQEIEEKIRQLELKSEGMEEDSKSEGMEEDSFVSLTGEQMELVEHAFSNGREDEVLSEAFNISIKRRDVATLHGLEWLNDEIINFYFNLIADRSRKLPGLPKVHVMSSFFYPSLVQNGYTRVKRWTKKVNIFNLDLLLLPVHLGIHWCLAVIDFRSKCVRYYDSMKGVNEQCLQVLARYLPQESQDKLKVPYSMADWTCETVQDIPEQMNGSDCGVFACKYAEYVARDARIDFTQQNMPYFRKRMVYEIMVQELL